MFIFFRVPFRARLGEWDSAQNIEPLPVIDMNVTKVVIHPQYNPKNLRFDLAILFLDKPVELGASPTIAHICLPSQPLSNLRCWVSGWGKSDFSNSGSYQAVLVSDVKLIMNMTY